VELGRDCLKIDYRMSSLSVYIHTYIHTYVHTHTHILDTGTYIHTHAYIYLRRRYRRGAQVELGRGLLILEDRTV